MLYLVFLARVWPIYLFIKMLLKFFI